MEGVPRRVAADGVGGFCKAGGEREPGVAVEPRRIAATKSYLARVSVPLQGKPRRPPAPSNIAGENSSSFSPFPIYLQRVYALAFLPSSIIFFLRKKMYS